MIRETLTSSQARLKVAGVGQVRRDERVAAMMNMARELAAHAHRVQMIEAMLAANGYPEAAEFIDQPHISNELREIAERARRGGA